MNRLVCYGDSNTYGYDARDVFGGRLPADQRWTDILSKALRCDMINCGMNGRVVPRYPRSVENDVRLIRRHFPFDLLIVMLGTNDILTDREPEDTAEAMLRFLSILQQDLSQCNILLCSPPQVSGLGDGFSERLALLSGMYAQIAQQMALCFCDVSSWPINLAADGIHFSAAGHRTFAEYMEQTILNRS